MRQHARSLLLWLSWRPPLGAVLLLAWAFPRAFPFLPRDWSVTRDEAAAIALERLRDLGRAGRATPTSSRG